MNWEVSSAPMCRACMEMDETFISMDDNDSASRQNLLQKLVDLTSIEINKNDGLPTMLCKKCTYHTNAFYEFKQLVKDTERKLRKMFEITTDSVKEEISINDSTHNADVESSETPKLEIPHSFDENISEEQTIQILQATNDVLNPADEEICIETHDIQLLKDEKDREITNIFDSNGIQYTISYIPSEEAANSVLDGEVIRAVDLEDTILAESNPERKDLVRIDFEDNSAETSLENGELVDDNGIQEINDNAEGENSLDSEDSDTDNFIGPKDDIVGSLNDTITRIKEIKKNGDSKEYQCTLCLQNYNELSRVLIHIVENHVPTTGPFFCIVCEKDCESRRELKKHVKTTHTGPSPYTCFICKKAYTMKRYLKRHMVCHRDFARHRCPKCGVRYKVKSELYTHLSTHAHGPAYQCNQCPRVFNHKGNYKRHLMFHLDPLSLHLPKYPCNECGKRFLNNRTLETHLRVHTGEKPFKCRVCDKNFSQQGNLLNHMKSVHSNPRNYTCEVCGKSFNQKATLKDHSLLHTGEKPHVCTVCGMAFTFSSAMRRHMWTHSEGKPFGCDVCQARFIGMYDLKRHMRIHVQKPKLNKKRSLVKQDNFVPQELMEEIIVLEDTPDAGEILMEPILLADDTSQISPQKDSKKENVDALFNLIQYG